MLRGSALVAGNITGTAQMSLNQGQSHKTP